MIIEPKFPECKECRFFNKRVELKQCRLCGSGEFFEEKDESDDPRRASLTKLFGGNNDR